MKPIKAGNIKWVDGVFMANSCQKSGIPTGSLENFSSKTAQQGTTEASNQPGPESFSRVNREREKILHRAIQSSVGSLNLFVKVHLQWQKTVSQTR